MSRRILVVDDDQAIQWLLHKLPQNTICKVDLTTGGLGDLKYLTRRFYTTLLPDVTLPRINGLQVQAIQKYALQTLPSIIALNRTGAAPRQATRMDVSNSLVKNFNYASLPSISSTV